MLQICQVDFDCISSLFTFDHMQNMCLNYEVPVAYPDYDMLDAEQNNTVVVDAGRIYKLPFPFSLVNLLHKCSYRTLMTYNFFTTNDDSDTGKSFVTNHNQNVTNNLKYNIKVFITQ